MNYQCYNCGEVTTASKEGPFLVKASFFPNVEEISDVFDENSLFAICDKCAKELGLEISERAAAKFPDLELGVLGAAVAQKEQNDG